MVTDIRLPPNKRASYSTSNAWQVAVCDYVRGHVVLELMHTNPVMILARHRLWFVNRLCLVSRGPAARLVLQSRMLGEISS